MANGGLQTVGFFLGYLGLVLNMCCLFLPYWKMDDISNQTVVAQRKYSGLWLECTYLMSTGGVYQCQKYQRFFIALPMYLQGARGFAVVTIVLGFLSLVTGIVGMECTRLAEDTEGTKRTMGVVSGACNILSAISFLIATSWFAAQVFMDFQDERSFITQQTQLTPNWVYGYCLWIGWGSSVLTLGAGVLMLAGSLGDDGDDDDRQSMGFQMGNARLLSKPQNNYV